MRGTKAKALRDLAEQATVGKPWAGYAAKGDKCIRKITNKAHPQYGQTIQVEIKRIILHPECTKAAYRRLKAAFKAGKMSLTRRSHDRERIRPGTDSG